MGDGDGRSGRRGPSVDEATRMGLRPPCRLFGGCYLQEQRNTAERWAVDREAEVGSSDGYGEPRHSWVGVTMIVGEGVSNPRVDSGSIEEGVNSELVNSCEKGAFGKPTRGVQPPAQKGRWME